MDATVPQPDGFHFVYILPFTDRRWLVEHTVYANDALLDRADLRRRALEEIARRGLRVADVVREEQGVLPLPWRGASRSAGETAGPFVAGYRGGWFHPVTGYSFPIAIRLALAAAQADTVGAFRAAATELWRDHERQAVFGRLLNRLMFTATDPAQRWRLLARFYALPVDTIERFYAMQMTTYDRVRLLAGRPPRGLSFRAAFFPKDLPKDFPKEAP
jgi:lycopene beta-cyclase